MFFKFLKGLFAKRKLRKSSPNIKDPHLKKIQTIGLLIDITDNLDPNDVINTIRQEFSDKVVIKILLYKERAHRREVFDFPFYTSKDITWLGDITKKEVRNFIDERFDLLVSYYKADHVPLCWVTHHSKADFKAGFAFENERQNHMVFHLEIIDYKVFISEMIRYLKICNKL